MDARKLAIPLLVFAGGAVLGRVLGLKALVRGAMTAVAVTGMAPRALLASATHGPARIRSTPRRKSGQRGAQRKSPRRKSVSTS